MNTVREVAVVLLISVIASFVAGLGFLLTVQFPPTIFVWETLTSFSLLALAGIAPTSLIWYVRRRHAPYRYFEGVLWGVVGLAFSVTIFMVMSAFRFQQSASPMTTFFGLILMAFALCVPVLFTVAPLTVYFWHRAIRAMKPGGT
jgi:glucan phosphoethanolaminetransferase (alkaline phosphatase superfamily)